MNFLELYFLHEIFLSVIEFHEYDNIWEHLGMFLFYCL